jgi:hypothetical protein
VAGGAHDPKDLWPQGTGWASLRLAGYLSLALTPMFLFFVAVGSGALTVWGLLPAPVRRRPS